MPSGGVSRSPSVALADMNGDGKREIVCAGTDGQLRIVSYNATFYPGWTAVRYSPKTSSASESSPVVADIDGNGQLDILIGSEDAQLYGFKADATPLAGFPIHLGGEVRGTPLIWDFNGDGNAEILLADWDKNLYAWTYPGVFTYNPARDWTMFRHDAERTGRVGSAVVVAVEGVAAQSTEPIEGGIRLRWKLPAADLAQGGAWRAFRSDAVAQAPAEGRLSAVPEGFVAVGGGPVAAGADGWVAVDDRTVEPGRTYAYVLARVAAETGTAPLAFGPYAVEATADAPSLAYLAPPFPNPGGGSQTLAFGLPEGLPAGTMLHLDLYDVRGARVRALVSRPAEPGRYVVSWDGRDDGGVSLAAGVYLYRLTAGPVSLGGRLVRLTR
jgi:hypothetical protein